MSVQLSEVSREWWDEWWWMKIEKQNDAEKLEEEEERQMWEWISFDWMLNWSYGAQREYWDL